jgi:hypothetical protein
MSAAASSSSASVISPCNWEWVNFKRLFPEHTDKELFVGGQRPTVKITDAHINPALLDKIKTVIARTPVIALYNNGKSPFIPKCMDDTEVHKMTLIEMNQAVDAFYAGSKIDTSTPDRTPLIVRNGDRFRQAREGFLRMLDPYKVSFLLKLVEINDNAKHGNVRLTSVNLKQAAVFWTAHKLNGNERERLWFAYPREIEYLARQMHDFKLRILTDLRKEQRWRITKIVDNYFGDPQNAARNIKTIAKIATVSAATMFFFVYTYRKYRD